MDQAAVWILTGIVVMGAASGGYRWWDQKTGNLSRPLLDRQRLGLTETGWLTRHAATILQRMCAAQVVEQDATDPTRYRLRQGLEVQFGDDGVTTIKG